MKEQRHLLLIAALIVSLWAPITAKAGLPPFLPDAPGQPSATLVPVQLRLIGSTGAPVNGYRTMIFRLYNVASGGSPLWQEIWINPSPVPVIDGVASVMLGSLNPLPQSLLAANPALWLGVTVDPESEMQPRVQLSSAPIAMTVADGAITAAKIVTGAVTADKLAARYAGYVTWIGQQYVAGPGWVDLFATNYSNVTVTVSTNSLLDVSALVTLRNTGGSGRAAYKIRVDGVDVTSAYNESAQPVSVSSRTLHAVGPGQHVISIQLGSWDNVTVQADGAMSLHALVLGR